jgi:hypothetical protein
VRGEAYACGWQRETAAVGGEIWRGFRRGGDQVMTRIDPVGRYISRSMRAGCGRLYRGWGAGGPIVYLVCAKKNTFNPQIGSGGTMRTGLRGLLELLLGNRQPHYHLQTVALHCGINISVLLR